MGKLPCDVSKRGDEQRQKITKRLQRSLHWVPLVDSLWCATEHSIFAGFHIFPIPFATVLSCTPAASVSMVVFYMVLPSEVRTLPNTLDSLKFTMCTWMGYLTGFIAMLFYTAFFSTATTEVQLAMSCVVAFVDFFLQEETTQRSFLGWKRPPSHRIPSTATKPVAENVGVSFRPPFLGRI